MQSPGRRDSVPVQVLNGKSDSFQMVKSQQQVSANQGRLDAFMTQSQPSTTAPAASATTAAPSRNTALPSASTACSHAAMGPAPRPPAAPSGPNVPGRPSWVRTASNTGPSQHGAAAPRDITNLPHNFGAGLGPTKGQQLHPPPNTISPGKQTRLQNFFHPKQVTHQPHRHHQEQLPGSRQMQRASALPMQANNNSVPAQPHAHLLEQHQPAQQHQSTWATAQVSNNAWQHAHGSAATKVSGVFADDDDFDDIWMSDHAFQVQIAMKAPAASVQQQHSITAMPVIDLIGSPAHKKAKS